MPRKAKTDKFPPTLHKPTRQYLKGQCSAFVSLRVLWRHWKEQDALPFDISRGALILHFRCESERNPRDTTRDLRAGVESELRDSAQVTYDLLCGHVAVSDVVRRQR
jgi:hypothetical protein